MKYLMRVGFIALLAFSAGSWASYPNDGVEVRGIMDLSREASHISSQGLPLLIEFSAEDCPYCHLLEEEFLKPMLRSGDYTDRVIIRKVDIGSDIPLTDFDGAPVTGRELARRYGVKVTPTVLLLDAEGRELSARLIGVTTPDFFGGYLDAAIDESRRLLRAVANRQVRAAPNAF